jgi:hypothetical protein
MIDVTWSKRSKKLAGLTLGTLVLTLGIIPVMTTAAHAATNPCGGTNITQVISESKSGDLDFFAYHDNICITFQELYNFNHTETGLDERVRFRDSSNNLLKEVILGGTIGSGFTKYVSYPNYAAAEICAAIVQASNTSVVTEGPVCITT